MQTVTVMCTFGTIVVRETGEDALIQHSFESFDVVSSSCCHLSLRKNRIKTKNHRN